MRDNKLEKENLFTLKEIDSLHEQKKENASTPKILFNLILQRPSIFQKSSSSTKQ